MTALFSGTHKDILQKCAKEWLHSPEGHASMMKALQEAKETTTKLQEERRVDSKSLQEPFSV